MKTRIITDGAYFFPQRKTWFGWRFFYQPGTPQIDGLELGPEIVSFGTQQDAVQFFQPTPWSVSWEGAA